MLNIVIPMAGRGSRFANAGYDRPKPLLDLGGRPMIEWVIENVKPNSLHRFIFICLAEHLKEYPEVAETLRGLCPNCEIVEIDSVTEGAACTVLLAKELINNEDPLMIANSDQYVDCDIDSYLDSMGESDGLIMTFEANDPKWSYCRLDENGEVCEVVEKEVVSNLATVGIYNFRRGCDFVEAAELMIEQDLRVNGEFYVAPAYNLMIQKGAKVRTHSIGKRGKQCMFGLGTPVDFEYFKTTELYRSRGVLT